MDFFMIHMDSFLKLLLQVRPPGAAASIDRTIPYSREKCKIGSLLFSPSGVYNCYQHYTDLIRQQKQPPQGGMRFIYECTG